MTGEFWRYYFFLENDAGNFIPLIRTMQKNGIHHYPLYSMEVLNKEESFSHPLQKDNISILVLRCSMGKNDWADALGQLDSWKEEAGVNDADIIAETSIFLSTDMSWEDTLLYSQNLSQHNDDFAIGIAQGRMTRLCSLWPQGSAYYACHLDECSQLSRNFLASELPLLEASFLRLRTIAYYLKEQKDATLQEKEQLDQDLSNTLHTQLVMEKGGIEEALELERQIEGLSRAYGKIAGDYNTLLSAANRLSSLLKPYKRQMLSLQGAVLSDDFINDMYNPYLERLQEIEEAQGLVLISRENYRAAIEVVQSKIDIMNARSNMATQNEIRNLMQMNVSIQKQGLVFQYAAGLIEFIVLAYYSHSLWSHLVPGAYETIPGWIQFLVVIAFSGNTVYCTHLIAEYIQGEHHVKNRLIVAAIPLLIILLAVIAASALISSSFPR